MHTIHKYISLIRLEQLKRYLYIYQVEVIVIPHHLNIELTPESELQYGTEFLEQVWWHKLEPMISYFQSASEMHYLPSSNVAIDETMIKCFGQSSHTFKMPANPIRHKFFSPVHAGYI